MVLHALNYIYHVMLFLFITTLILSDMDFDEFALLSSRDSSSDSVSEFGNEFAHIRASNANRSRKNKTRQVTIAGEDYES